MKHGTVGSYSKGCRCDECREANTAHHREQRARRKTRPVGGRHGRASTYANWGCRCTACARAHAEAMQRQQAARLDASSVEIPHGTDSGFRHWGCRCEQCADAFKKREQLRRSRRATATPPEADDHRSGWTDDSLTEDLWQLGGPSPGTYCEACGLDLHEAQFDPEAEYCADCSWNASIDPLDSPTDADFDEIDVFDELSAIELTDRQLRDAEVFLRMGVSLDEAVAWLAVDPSEAEAWIREGLNPADFERWAAFGPAIAKSLREADEMSTGYNYEIRALLDDDELAAEFATWRGGLQAVADTLQGVVTSSDRLPPTLPGPEWLRLTDDFAEALEWIDRGFTTAEAARWTGTNCDPSTAELLHDCGAAPALVRRWYDADILPASLAEIIALAGIERIERTDPVELRAAGALTDPETIATWSGLNAKQIFEAVDNGYSSADDYLTFAPLGVAAADLDGVRASSGENASSALVALFAEKTGLARSDIDEYVNLGLSVAEIGEWAEGGFSPGSARHWINAQISAKEAKTWIKAGISTAARAAEWRQVKLSPRAAGRWKAAGVHSPTEARRWADAGIGADSAVEWSELGFTVDQATQWSRAGVAPSVAQRRVSAGLRPPPD